MRVIWVIAVALVLLAEPLRASADYSGDGGVPAFYRWDGAVQGAPGAVLRREAVEAGLLLENAGSGERILYVSTNGLAAKDRVVVSGDVFLPKGAPPVGGWPIVAWAHGTTGVADVCAPSFRGRSKRDKAYLNHWLAEGFAVVASDYQGLGTPGVHPYMLYRPEAYGILDAVRASLNLYSTRLKNRVVIVGQSQGSAAALGATYLAKTYAPDLHLIASVATGLVVNMASPVSGAPQVPVPPYQGGDAVDAAYSVLYLMGMDESMNPQLNPPNYMTPAGIPLLQLATHACLSDLIKLASDNHLTPKNAFTPARNALLRDEDGYGAFPSATFTTPIFTGTGLADSEAGTAPQYNFISDMCASGDRIEWHYYRGLTHNGTVNVSFNDSLPFVRKALAANPPPSNCSSLHPPGPLQTPTPGIPFNT